MPDRIEREIEEILARLDDEPSKDAPGKKPIPIRSARKKARSPGTGSTLRNLNLPALMFAGAGVMMAGLVLSRLAEAFIWVSFAGVVMFLSAFAISFARGWPRPSSGKPQQGAYWRDRYIRYDEPEQGVGGRLKRWFRR